MKKIVTKTEEKVIKTNYIEVTSLIEYLEEESKFWALEGTNVDYGSDYRKESLAKSSVIDCMIYELCEHVGIKYPF